MLRFAAGVLITGLASLASFSQSPAPKNTPDPYDAQRMVRQTEQDNRRFEAKPSNGRGFNTFARRSGNLLLHKHFHELYRRPNDSEITLPKPSAAVRTKYLEFLKGTESGLIVLAPTFDCARNAVVVDASERCTMFDFPGAGSAYSFRYENYRIPRLSDISFTGEQFLTVGDFTQGIITVIGDVPIEQVSSETSGMPFLNSFVPKASDTDKDFISGTERDGFTYKRSWEAATDTTYLMRSIAFRGQSYRSFENVSYDEFDFDKRRDVIVAFRIAERNADGSITLVWKKLADERSPTIESLISR